MDGIESADSLLGNARWSVVHIFREGSAQILITKH